ncbi:uncharacterized protein LOC128190539 isoform X1 [Crassostrea angulata]|uniref:uncharacterized protein LOC128190539 isoform X1 n=1 Tax=Magallana angulata TaxID=2784310 RepID=UPI0022B15F0D|nr:uncharacterized protein LOC128190539 isoform X1 [Crassostrea angulata]
MSNQRLCQVLPVRHRSFTCHKGHKHKDEDEVKECNRLEERKLKDELKKTKVTLMNKTTDRHGNVHEQTVVVEGDKSIVNQIGKSGQLALEGKIEKKSKDKKH